MFGTDNVTIIDKTDLERLRLLHLIRNSKLRNDVFHNSLEVEELMSLWVVEIVWKFISRECLYPACMLIVN